MKNTKEITTNTKEITTYVSLGGALIINQLFENILKKEIKIRVSSQKQKQLKDIDDQPLGNLIRVLEKLILRNENNTKIIKKFRDFNIMRINITHKIFSIEKLPENFDLFMLYLIDDKKISYEISQMMRFAFECANLIKMISN